MPDKNIPVAKNESSLVAENTDTHLDTIPPKKSKRTLFIIAIPSLIILAGIGFGIFLNVSQPEAINSQTSSAEKPIAAPNKTAKTLQSTVESVRTNLNGRDISDISSEQSRFPYLLTGNKYLTYPQTGAKTEGIKSEVSSIAAQTKELRLAENSLRSQGFAIYSNISDLSVDYEGVYTYWTSLDYACKVATNTIEPTPSYNYTLYSLTVSCAELDDYKATAATLKPFYDAYLKANDHYFDNLVFVDPTVKDSQVKGYKTASIPLSSYGASFGGFAGLFYQTPDKVWHYFVGTQSSLLCTAYNTNDLKNAYFGEDCYDEADENARVKL